jgi:hypothetical protein
METDDDGCDDERLIAEGKDLS